MRFLLLLLVLVPYVSQEGEHADKYRWDCGAANAAMMVWHYTGMELYPDELMSIIGRDRYIRSGELQYLMENYGLKTEVWRFENVDEVIERAPVIILVYHHWILVTGGHGDEITFHDTLVGPNIPEDKDLIEYRWLVSGMPYQGIVVTQVLNDELHRLKR